jgi:hydrogenase nickel incorporation protein HypA/HybF
MLLSVHEWALADAVVESIRSALGGAPADRLKSVEILVGELQAIDPEIFRFGLSTLLEEVGIGMEKIAIEVEKAEMRCRACGFRWNLDEDPGLDSGEREAVHFLPESLHAFVRCPGCGGADFGVEKGRGVRIGRLEMRAGRGSSRPRGGAAP